MKKTVLFSAVLLAIAGFVLGQKTPDTKIGGSTEQSTGQPQKRLISTKAPEADNSRCHVCHLNFEDEELAVTHAKAGVGCVKCHGESEAHSADEKNVTPPDTMFPKEKLNAACIECHKPEKLHKLHQPVLKGTAKTKKYCTDCHGEHRLSHRTRHWDKATGKLLPRQSN